MGWSSVGLLETTLDDDLEVGKNKMKLTNFFPTPWEEIGTGG